MENDNNQQFQRNDVFSKRIRAGKRRTYFFDVRTTKGNDYYLTITESKKRFHDDGYERHKIFVYKEDFNKFIHTLEEVVDHIKNNLMPEYDFDMFTREPEDITYDESKQQQTSSVDEPKAESTEIAAEVETEVIAEASEPVNETDDASEVSQSEDANIEQGNEEEVISWD